MKLNKHDPKTEMEMNMTPMIDVVFLLIIFFMIITDMTQQDLEELKLPIAVEAVEDKPDPDEVRPVINIFWDGRMIVKRKELYDPEEDDEFRQIEGYLADQAQAMIGRRNRLGIPAEVRAEVPDGPLLVRADENSPFHFVQKIMEVCGRKGIQIWKLQLAAAQPEEGEVSN
jgi:biopolymer transport protein ExbD